MMGMICGQRLDRRVASRVDAHGVAGCGACQRRAPTGGAANGMPWNCRAESPIDPWTMPWGVLRVSGSPSTTATAGAGDGWVAAEVVEGADVGWLADELLQAASVTAATIARSTA